MWGPSARPCGDRSSACTASTWPGEDGVEYNLAHGDWLRLLRRNGFEVLDLIELQAPPEAKTHEYYDFVSADWGRQWPAEEIWVAQLRA